MGSPIELDPHQEFYSNGPTPTAVRRYLTVAGAVRRLLLPLYPRPAPAPCANCVFTPCWRRVVTTAVRQGSRAKLVSTRPAFADVRIRPRVLERFPSPKGSVLSVGRIRTINFPWQPYPWSRDRRP